MKKLILILIVAVSITQCVENNNKQIIEYKPKYQEHWAIIDSTIQSGWMNNLLQPTDKLPFKYLSIAKWWTGMYYWDIYFMNAGLLLHNLNDMAKNHADNLLYEVNQYGYVPNCSDDWGLNRSQPPYLSQIVKDVYEHMEEKDSVWLKYAYDILLKEYEFWMDGSITAIEKNTTPIPGLLRYYHHATFDELVEFYNQIAFRFDWDENISDSLKVEAAIPYISEAEAGVDFTPRFDNRCHEFVAIDLNSYLYLYEMNFIWMEKELNFNSDYNWQEKADKRKELLNKYCWSEERGLFMDYDFVNKQHGKIASIASFIPLMTGIASNEQAKRTLENLPLFEYEWGITPCEKNDHKMTFQWDYPTGWTPGYFMISYSLNKYGYKKDAQRIAAKYLDMVSKNFLAPNPSEAKNKNGEVIKRKPGNIYEKYNAVTGNIYDAEYPSPVFMGWSAGVFTYLYNYLN